MSKVKQPYWEAENRFIGLSDSIIIGGIMYSPKIIPPDTDDAIACMGCAFITRMDCRDILCDPLSRFDGEDVIFVKRK